MTLTATLDPNRLTHALTALEARGRELTRAAPRRTVDTRVRRFDPATQVYAQSARSTEVATSGAQAVQQVGEAMRSISNPVVM